MHGDSETSAWLWLLSLPRLKIPDDTPGPKYRELSDRQIKISLCPGELCAFSGAPYVKVTALLPGCPERIEGTGNSLAVACERLHYEAWAVGIKLEFPSIFHSKRIQGTPA